MSATRETLVFIPAWNEEESLPVVLDELRRSCQRPRSRRRRRVDRPDGRGCRRARRRGSLVRREPGPAGAISAGYGYAVEHGYAFCGRVDADGQHPVAELRNLLELVRSGQWDVAVGSRFATVGGNGFSRERYESSAARRLGTGVLRRSIEVVLDQPFHDATSGMYAVNARAMAILAAPYSSGAPEVEGILRLHDEGLRVTEVPVEMRERTSGESKLQGKKAIVLVLTVAGALVTAEFLRRRRS